MTEGSKRCGAKTRDGGTCSQWAVKGRERCRMHGGRQPRGLAHHATVHGRFSKDLPARLVADYQAALADAVRRHVDDRAVLEAIGREVERIVTTREEATAAAPVVREGAP